MARQPSDLLALLETDLADSGWGNNFPVDSYEHRAAEALRRSLFKKLVPSESDRARCDAAALDLFHANNKACKEWVDAEGHADEELKITLEHLRSEIDDFFHMSADGGCILSFWSIARKLGLGNGSNIGCLNNDLYSKLFSSQLTTAQPGLHSYYVLAISDNPTWSISEWDRYQELGIRVVAGSSLSFALKNSDISRVTCTEPTLEMLFQKGSAEVMETQLVDCYNIDLAVQPRINAELARVGSLNGRFATIDLKSASDRIPLTYVEKRLPADATRWLKAFRSAKTVLPDGTEESLHMVSSMGNAYTFPLQTALFTCMVLAVYRTLGIKPVRPGRPYKGPDGELRPQFMRLGNFGVFGDDIICVAEAYPLLCKLLAHEGHVVNEDKSFCSGDFRESCGSDWYQGRDVRGVYIKSLRDVMDYCSAINRLNDWSARHFMPLPRLVSALYGDLCELWERETRKRAMRKGSGKPPPFVPMSAEVDSGVRVPERLAIKKRCKKYGGLKYQCLVVRSPKVSVSRGAIEGRGRVAEQLAARLAYLPEALILVASAGHLRDGELVVRVYDRRLGVREAYVPGWDVATPLREPVFGRHAYSVTVPVITILNLGMV